MILYEDDFVRVTDGWFRGVRVIDKRTSAITIPNMEQRLQFGLVWHKVRRSRADLSVNKRRSEDLFMAWFAYSVLDPSSENAKRFVTMTPDAAAIDVIATANDIETSLLDWRQQIMMDFRKHRDDR